MITWSTWTNGNSSFWDILISVMKKKNIIDDGCNNLPMTVLTFTLKCSDRAFINYESNNSFWYYDSTPGYGINLLTLPFCFETTPPLVLVSDSAVLQEPAFASDV